MPKRYKPRPTPPPKPWKHPTVMPDIAELDIREIGNWPFSIDQEERRKKEPVTQWKAVTSILNKGVASVHFYRADGSVKYTTTINANRSDEEIKRMADDLMLLLNMKDGAI